MLTNYFSFQVVCNSNLTTYAE